MADENNSLQQLEKQILARGEAKLKVALQDPAVKEVIRQRVCALANEIIFNNSEWKKIRKNEKGDSIGHRFTDNTNWIVEVNPDKLSVECRNITRPSRSIFNTKKFNYEHKYEYNSSKDPYNGAALSMWIDQGLWIDPMKLFQEMARVDDNGKINADKESMQRNAIPFLEKTQNKIANDTAIKQAVINAANNNK